MRTISKLLIGLNLIVGLCVHASPVTFTWDVTTTNDVRGYIIYFSQEPPRYVTNAFNSVLPPAPNTPTYLDIDVTMTNVTRIPVGNVPQATVDVPEGKHFAWLRVQDIPGAESRASNVLQLETLPPPQNFRIVIVEATVDVSGTNWQQVGMFRLKLP